MADWIDYDHPDREIDSSDSQSVQLEEHQRGWGMAFGLAIILWPVGGLVFVMRGNLVPQLDADLAWILTKFCDTVLAFCLIMPFCPVLPGEWGAKLSHRVSNGLFRLLTIVKWIFVAVFTVAAVISIGYCVWLIWNML